jgi:hypothetical protein
MNRPQQIRPVVNKKAPWTDDAAIDTCMRCWQTSFGLSERRHREQRALPHTSSPCANGCCCFVCCADCRECGFVVCDGCSRHRAPARGYDQAVRVCNFCFALLASGAHAR